MNFLNEPATTEKQSGKTISEIIEYRVFHIHQYRETYTAKYNKQ